MPVAVESFVETPARPVVFDQELAALKLNVGQVNLANPALGKRVGQGNREIRRRRLRARCEPRIKCNLFDSVLPIVKQAVESVGVIVDLCFARSSFLTDELPKGSALGVQRWSARSELRGSCRWRRRRRRLLHD